MSDHLTFVVVHANTIGLANDASIIAHALHQALPRAKLYILKLTRDAISDYAKSIKLPSEILDLVPFDCAFFLEHAHANSPLLESRFARRFVYVPNIEWIDPSDEAVVAKGMFDRIFFKNEFSQKMFSTLSMLTPTHGTVLTEWTSIDILDRSADQREQDFNSFLHVRGVSMLKQTEAILTTWQRRKDFPTLTVTMYYPDRFDSPDYLRSRDNIQFALGRLPASKIRALQNRIGLHLCPSGAEGFGHTLNEARSVGAVLLTTDAPPMNSFVAEGCNGYLVPVRPGRMTPLHRSIFFEIEPEDLEQKIELLLQQSIPQRREFGIFSRQLYVAQQERFLERFRQQIDSLV
jgi:glycosyltransferase involved in cell wall biosynthesis